MRMAVSVQKFGIAATEIEARGRWKFNAVICN